jgi:hypothetical protein
MAGILRNTRTLEHANVSRWLEVPLPVDPEQESALRAHEGAVADLESRIKAARGELAAAGKGSAQGGVIAVGDLNGIVVDDTQAEKVGLWKASQHSGSYIGTGYLHDNNGGKGESSLTFQPRFPEAGKFEVWLAYSPGRSRSDAVPVTIFSADGEEVVPVDMARGAADCRPIRLPRPIQLREERPELRANLQRGDDRACHRRCRALPPG